MGLGLRVQGQGLGSSQQREGDKGTVDAAQHSQKQSLLWLLGFMVYGLGFRVQGLWFMVYGLGFGILKSSLYGGFYIVKCNRALTFEDFGRTG